MTAQPIETLKAEIARLEEALARHRRALQILEGHEGRQPEPAGLGGQEARPRPQGPRPAPVQTAKAQPGTGPAAPPSLRTRIRDFLRRSPMRAFTPSEIAQALSQQGPPTLRENVQRRLSEMVKAKQVIRHEGKYRLAR
ncbi:MAG: hypothetical protein NZ578_04495 [Candidatus Binatia bacterium]|nr:hypothetical protein [Candidatus Binatia bacterium]